ncbi:hypothetical protein LJR153_007226 [Paenibacillus sp. LjRoot153]|uniref:hypothetical protein n=1 Tax=Paenibacillus sp. LjRoot153 TaxID=3342270 RepID=UPI003ED16963
MKAKGINFSQLDDLDNKIQIEVTDLDKKSRRNVLNKYVSEEEIKKTKKTKKAKPVCFSIPSELDRKIDEYCEIKYMKKSTFAVLALEEFLKKKLSEESGI